METPDLLRYIRRWQARLTGKVEEEFEGQSAQDLLDRLAELHAGRMVLEQLCALTAAQLMVEHEVSGRSIGAYYWADECRSTPVGRFNYATGIGEWAGIVRRELLPLLRNRSYRPFLRLLPPNDTARLVRELFYSKGMKEIGLDAGTVADTLYERGLSPAVAKKILCTLRQMAKGAAGGEKMMLEALTGLRSAGRAASDAVAQADETAFSAGDVDIEESNPA